MFFPPLIINLIKLTYSPLEKPLKNYTYLFWSLIENFLSLKVTHTHINLNLNGVFDKLAIFVVKSKKENDEGIIEFLCSFFYQPDIHNKNMFF
jgi:hypothetical protein